MASPEDLLPHRPPMVLLDQVVNHSDDAVTAALTIGPQTPFLEAGLGVPAHIGLEWMAQACGAFAGLEAQRANEPVRLGFLLGTRRYQAARAYFTEGERLEIGAKLVFREGGMGVFDCKIIGAGGADLAIAQLTVYQPEGA
jgi:predicted hotdog family 3-hydroxylacyl-ACP dehydratase